MQGTTIKKEVVSVHAMTTYRGIKVLFVTLTLGGDKSTPHSDSFIPGKVPPYPLKGRQAVSKG